MVVRLSALQTSYPSSPGIFLVLISVRGRVDTRAMEGLGKLKNPMTSSGVEPTTVQLVAYSLNQLSYRVPSILTIIEFNSIILRLHSIK
jgi:hypothetical protein